MSIATNLAKLGLGVSNTGVVAAAQGGTGTTTGGSSGPKITGITVTNSSYANLDDTAVDVLGGYIKITGSGFVTGCQVLVNTTAATSVTFISATEVRAQVPATVAGTYIVYVVNSDGGVAIRVNGITFSATPTWTSTSPLSGAVNAAISIQLTATGAATFALASGSTLPSGVSLSSSGLLTGTVTGISSETTYNFTVKATDAELQDSPRTFAFTISVGDLYFMYNSLLLSGNGTNLAQNNTFVDSSTNNFAVTRAGNTTQGTFSPYGPNWSNYFDNTGDYLTAPANTALAMGSGAFTMEAWVYNVGGFSTDAILECRIDYTSAGGYAFLITSSGYLNVYTNSAFVGQSSTALVSGTWYHVALVRTGTGSNQTTYYINGVASGTITLSGNFTDASTVVTTIGGTPGGENVSGYISNLRIVKGTAVYTSTFTPSTTPLTAITNTSLLTCQSNRFKDNSTNNFTITKNGDVSVQRFSPFSPTAAYSTSTIGGSGYFDGTGDYLTAPNNAALAFGTGAFTVEIWLYILAYNASTSRIIDWRSNGSGPTNIPVLTLSASGAPVFYADVITGALITGSSVIALNTWAHLAIVRSGSTVTMYLNGTSIGSASSSLNLGVETLNLNDPADGFTYGLRGYFSDLRIVKGTAVYTTAFTPPTAPVTAIANTALLLNFTNAGIYDATMLNNLETVGDAKISTIQSKFGGSSMSFDGTGDYLTAPANPNWQFTGDYTVEAWIYVVTLANGTIYATGGSGAADQFTYTAAGELYFANQGTGTGVITAGSWIHVAAARSGTTQKIFVNGTAQSTTTVTGTIGQNLTAYIGRRSDGVNAITGYIDDLRITKGYARYTANFTPPTSALLTQ